MSILNFIILYSDRIIISKNIDVIRPFIIAMVIIKDTGQSIFINRKYPIMPKLPTQQPNKHHNVVFRRLRRSMFAIPANY